MSENLLRLTSIDSFYGSFQVHHDLNLNVQPGEIVCLLGGNASGKSSAMKLILGLLQPKRGSVFLEEKDVTNLACADRIRLGLASVPESRRIFADMSVEENIVMGAHTRNDKRAVREDFERVLAIFPRLRERLKQRGGTLSGGEQQMLAMARAIMSRPKLICMDEPTMGLSPLWVERVLEQILALHDQGMSVFMVEQNAHQALSIADRGYVLQGGRIVLEGDAVDLANDERVREAYLGREQMSQI